MTEMPPAFRLDGKVAVVTGAASGIGSAAVARLTDAGATVVGGDVRAGKGIVEADVSRREQVDALVQHAVDAHGRLDAMVNVAGIMRTAALVDLTEESLDEVMAVNLKGTLFGVQAALRAMRELGNGGAVVNTASAAIDAPGPSYGAYAMSKAAVAMLTRTAATEAGEFGVRVNAVAPGFVETAMTGRWWTGDDGSVDEDARQGLLEMVGKRSPLGVTGEPDDVAWAILYLVCDASRFVTGQILRPNGGMVMPW